MMAAQLTARPLKTAELPTLTSLFTYHDTAEMLAANTSAIESGEIDIFGLYEGNALIGELRVRYRDGDERRVAAGRRAYLYAFRVLPPHQGRGAGQFLLGEVLAYLSARGYTEFTVGVEDDNPRAQHIYRAHGFTECIARLTESYQGDTYAFDLLLKREL